MQAIKQAVEKYRQLILDAEQYIWKHPETGFREEKTSKYMEDAFRALGYELVMAGDIPGFYTRVETGRPGPEVLVMAELDSIICPAHPDADPETGAAHSCGHHAQCAAMLGIAAALTEKEVLEGLSGSIRLALVPAEELLELAFRSELKRAGRIRYMGGKTEFLARGYFDGADLAILIHTHAQTAILAGSVGCVTKNIVYKGRAAHAGSEPWAGCNALYAANCGLNAVNAIRETFREADIIRVHPIITKGGDMVNAVPEVVTMESYVRGSSFPAIVETNRKVNRALIGAALSLGANVEIIDAPGYAPLKNDPGMIAMAKEAADSIIPEHGCTVDPSIISASTDVGDLSGLMPVVQPFCGGAAGIPHGNNYAITDPEKACVDSAKWQLAMVRLLLQDGAVRARKIMEDYQPLFPSKEAYLAYVDRLCRSGDRISYREDGTAVAELE